MSEQAGCWFAAKAWGAVCVRGGVDTMSCALQGSRAVSFISRFCLAVLLSGGTPWALQGVAAEGLQLNPGVKSSKDLMDMSLEDLMDIEVSGVSKKSEKAGEAAASVVVITREDIKRYGYRNLQEALQSAIGFYVSSDRNYEYLGVRGFSRPGDYNTRILLLLDGHKINDLNFDYAAIGEDLQIDINSLERIEITKGPSSAVWGTNALLGVVNLVTRSGAGLNGGNAIVEYGSHNRSKAYADYGTKLESGLEIAGGVSGLTSDGESDLYFPELNAPVHNFGTAEDRDGENAYRTYLKAAYEGFAFLLNSGVRRKEVPTGAFGEVLNADGNQTEDVGTHLDLSYKRKVNEASNGEFFTRAYFDRVKYDGGGVYDSGTDVPDIGGDSSDSSLAGAEVRYSQDIFSSLSMLVGAEYQDGYDMSISSFYWIDGEKVPSFTSDNSLTVASLYTEFDYPLLESLHFVAGARGDDYSTFGRKFSPRFGVVAKPLDDTTFKLLYGEAFRAPNNYETNWGDGAYYLPNRELVPEELRSYELIATQRAFSSEFSLSLFRYDLDKIIAQISNADQLLQFQNLAGVRSEGVEFQVQSRFANRINGHAGLSFQRAVDSDSDQIISNSPRQLANVGLIMPVWGDKFYLSPQFVFVGNRKTLWEEKTGTWRVLNLTATSDKLIPQLSFSLGVYDLLGDTRYAPAGDEHIQHRIQQDGRTFRVQVSRSF